jgi:hypothetical protein
MDQQQIGYVAHSTGVCASARQAGFWYDDSRYYPTPQASQRLYLLQAYGPTFSSWSSWTSLAPTHKAPFLQLNPTGINGTQAGLKYLQTSLPWVDGYSTTGVPDVSYSDAFDYSSRLAVTITSQSARRLGCPMPALSYDITDTLTARFCTAITTPIRRLARSTTPMSRSCPPTRKRGGEPSDVWGCTKLETSDNFEFGCATMTGRFPSHPRFLRQVPEQIGFDYRSMTKLTYVQNVGEAESIGGELEAAWKPRPWLTLLAPVPTTASRSPRICLPMPTPCLR